MFITGSHTIQVFPYQML